MMPTTNHGELLLAKSASLTVNVPFRFRADLIVDEDDLDV